MLASILYTSLGTKNKKEALQLILLQERVVTVVYHFPKNDLSIMNHRIKGIHHWNNWQGKNLSEPSQN